MTQGCSRGAEPPLKNVLGNKILREGNFGTKIGSQFPSNHIIGKESRISVCEMQARSPQLQKSTILEMMGFVCEMKAQIIEFREVEKLCLGNASKICVCAMKAKIINFKPTHIN